MAMVGCLLGCETSHPNGGTSGEPKPVAQTSARSKPKPTASAQATASASAPAPTSTADDSDPPWVKGLRHGCTKDADCMKVRACVSYAIRRDAEQTFKERISGTRFRCDRIEDAGAPVETRAACVDGTCEIITVSPKD